MAAKQSNAERFRQPKRYPGLMQEWAAMVLGRAAKTTTVDTPAAGPLFDTEAA